jgi:hypothetical protein
MTTAESGSNGAPQTPDQIREEIERTRADLADTVDALHAKVDVKSRAQAKLDDVKHRATTPSGKPRPELLAAAAGAVLVVAAVVWWRRR